MPLLAVFFGSAFGAVLNWFLQFFTKKVALYLTVITTLTTLTAALLAAISALISGLAVGLPSDAAFALYFLPDNTASCLAAYSSAAILKWTYDWNTDIITRSLN